MKHTELDDLSDAAAGAANKAGAKAKKLERKARHLEEKGRNREALYTWARQFMWKKRADQLSEIADNLEPKDPSKS